MADPLQFQFAQVKGSPENDATESDFISCVEFNHDGELLGDDLPVLGEVNLDLESYTNHYRGLCRIQRLEFIADHCESLRLQALRLAINYVKDNTYNVKDYLRLFRKLQEALNERGTSSTGGLPYDTQWVDTKTKQAGLRLEKIQLELKNSRNNSMKENIRRGQDDLGDHYLDCGELEAAFEAYSKSREYVITPRTQVNLCLNIIKVSILLRRWSAVSNHVATARSQPNNDNTTNPSISTKLNSADGLFELTSRHYKKAARLFLSANFDHFSEQPQASSLVGASIGGSRDSPSSAGQWEILAPVNIGVYGSLCALATYSRQELATQLVNSSSFKQFAELEPQLREAVARFYESKYASCLSILQDMKNNLLLDLYLAPHVERLYRLIRNKALVQYFEPYSTASMHKMAEAFNTTVVDLEKEIITLIYEGHIKARIDSHNKILYAKNADPRTLTFERAIQMGKLWQRQTRAVITRLTILNAGLVVGNPPQPSIQPGRTLSLAITRPHVA